jgi:hypothetical protein
VNRDLQGMRPVRPRRPAPGTVGGWVALAAVLTFLGGRAGLALAAAIVVWDLLAAPVPRVLMGVALLAFLAVPVVVLARGLPTLATLSPEFAAGSLLPHLLAGSGLALLVLGVLRDVRAGLPPRGARAELAAPSPADRALLPPQAGESSNGEEPR